MGELDGTNIVLNNKVYIKTTNINNTSNKKYFIVIDTSTLNKTDKYCIYYLILYLYFIVGSEVHINICNPIKKRNKQFLLNNNTFGALANLKLYWYHEKQEFKKYIVQTIREQQCNLQNIETILITKFNMQERNVNVFNNVDQIKNYIKQVKNTHNVKHNHILLTKEWNNREMDSVDVFDKVLSPLFSEDYYFEEINFHIVSVNTVLSALFTHICEYSLLEEYDLSYVDTISELINLIKNRSLQNVIDYTNDKSVNSICQIFSIMITSIVSEKYLQYIKKSSNNDIFFQCAKKSSIFKTKFLNLINMNQEITFEPISLENIKNIADVDESCKFYFSNILLNSWVDELSTPSGFGMLINIKSNPHKYDFQITNVMNTYMSICDFMDIVYRHFSNTNSPINTNDQNIIKDVTAYGNAILPIYISKEHWKCVKYHYKYVLGFCIFNNPLLYDPKIEIIYINVFINKVSSIINISISDVDILSLFTIIRTYAQICFEHGYNRGSLKKLKMITDKGKFNFDQLVNVVVQLVVTGAKLDKEVWDSIKNSLHKITTKDIVTYDVIKCLLIMFRIMNDTMIYYGSYNQFIKQIDEKYGLLENVMVQHVKNIFGWYGENNKSYSIDNKTKNPYDILDMFYTDLFIYV